LAAISVGIFEVGAAVQAFSIEAGQAARFLVAHTPFGNNGLILRRPLYVIDDQDIDRTGAGQ
jgi:hypothetical protein